MTISSADSLRLARDLHDGLAQSLTALGYQLDLALAHEDVNLEARRQIREARFHVDDLMTDVRREIFNLRRRNTEPLSARLASAVRDIDSRVPISFDCAELSADPPVEDELIQIAVELIRNSIKHARATLIEVHLYPINNRICLEVRDDGIGGAVVSQNSEETRFGLRGISERVEALHGSFELSFQHGTRAIILL